MSASISVYSGTAISQTGVRAGATFLTVDGESFDVVSDAEYDATTVKREELDGLSGFQGVSATGKAGMIGAKLRDNGNMTVSNFFAKPYGSISVIMGLANGKTVSGDGMDCLECSSVNTQEGTFTVKFIGGTVTENSL